MKKDVEIIIVGSGGSGTAEMLAHKLAESGKTAVIVVEDEKKSSPFEPEPIPYHAVHMLREPLKIVDDISDKKWYEHYNKFRKGKNKFGRKK
jgi:choline dehydrogenase-like flavoprotein